MSTLLWFFAVIGIGFLVAALAFSFTGLYRALVDEWDDHQAIQDAPPVDDFEGSLKQVMDILGPPPGWQPQGQILPPPGPIDDYIRRLFPDVEPDPDDLADLHGLDDVTELTDYWRADL